MRSSGAPREDSTFKPISFACGRRLSSFADMCPCDISEPPQDPRFAGISRLYGESALAAFRAAHVAIVGIGGVGSWVAEALARSGIGQLSLMDMDDICVTNINRQIHALEGTVGGSKTAVMAARLRQINPALRVDCMERFFTQGSVEELFSCGAHVMVDAIDSVRQKALLLAVCRARGTAVITVGGAGGRRDPQRIKCADLSRTTGDRLLMLTRKELRSRHGFPAAGKSNFKIPAIYSDEPPCYPQPDGTVSTKRSAKVQGGINCATGIGSVTHVTASFAFFAAAWVLDTIPKLPLR